MTMVTTERLLQLLGLKEVQISLLEEQLAEAKQRIAELETKEAPHETP